MSFKTFAAIDAGSYEIAMKIFEVSKTKGMREIDHIRHGIDMGTESYSTGKLSPAGWRSSAGSSVSFRIL